MDSASLLLRHDPQGLELPLPAQLREYQWEGISFLFRSDAALLADEMGLGKTVQAALALTLVLRIPGLDRALVVAPASLTLNWERELAKWSPGLVVRRLAGDTAEREATYQLPIEVLIGSYEQIRGDALDRIPSDTFDVVVLDEAQRIKNRESATAFACRLLPRRRAWALTATPLENHRSDLESVAEFLRPGLITRAMPKAELFARIEPHLLRRRKKEVLGDLPPVLIQDLVLDLSDEQRVVYDDVWAGRLDTLAAGRRPISTTALFALLTKLKQICNFDPATGKSSKLDAVLALIESLAEPSDKVILFSQYVETLEWLHNELGGATGFPLEIYHGELSGQERDAVTARFESSPGPRILLMSLRAGGVGLNLQSASVVVLFDRWWNPAVEVQAIYRAHRFDRNTPLHVLRFLVHDTVEERINEILEAKQALFEEFVEAAPTAEVPALTRGELLRILDLHRTEAD